MWDSSMLRHPPQFHLCIHLTHQQKQRLHFVTFHPQIYSKSQYRYHSINAQIPVTGHSVYFTVLTQTL